MSLSVITGVTLLLIGPMLSGCTKISRSEPTASASGTPLCSTFGSRPYSAATLPAHLLHSAFSKELLCQLSAWDALPSWTLSVATARSNWAELLHKNVVRADWPSYLRSTATEMIQTNQVTLGTSFVGHDSRKIEIPYLTPIYLRELMEILASVVVKPNSADPSATMPIDGSRKPEAASRLARLASMLEYTSYIDNKDFRWNPLLIFAARFVYYHELAHTTTLFSGRFGVKFRLFPKETRYEEEMRADYIALSFLLAELRNHRDLVHIAMSGISLAMSFLAVQEFSVPYTAEKRSTKNTHFRMARMKYWIEQDVNQGVVPSEAGGALTFFWDLCIDLLRRVEVIPSPAFELLARATETNETGWIRTRNEIVRWITFGDKKSVLVNIKAVRDWAFRKASVDEGARRVTKVLEYVLRETEGIEPELGLKGSLLSR